MTLRSTKQSTKLLVNGRVHSPTHPDATAMAVRGDVVAWLGSDDVGRGQFPDAEVQDLDGGFVAPGYERVWARYVARQALTQGNADPRRRAAYCVAGT